VGIVLRESDLRNLGVERGTKGDRGARRRKKKLYLEKRGG